MVDQSPSWIVLQSDRLHAQIDPHGAQLSVLRDGAAQDWLWGGDPAVWAGRAPLLFPIVGALAGGVYRLGSKSYPLLRHGFARGREFSVAAVSSTSAELHLIADEATFAVYPFRFELVVHVDVQGASLLMTVQVRNVGDVDMPASIGFHPGFRWPSPAGRSRADYFLEFEMAEPAPVRRLDPAGLLTDARHPTPVVGRRLSLSDSLFQQDVIIFDALNSRSLLYGCDTGPRLKVEFPDAKYLGVWTKPGAPFVCIEPWHGIADVSGFSGDFKEKTGIFVLAPAAEMSTTMVLTVQDS